MSKTTLNINLPVSILREGKAFIAYSPALDLSTAGKTYKEAHKRFGEIVEIFFEELQKRGTLNEVLESLGWEKKIKSQWTPPQQPSRSRRFVERIRGDFGENIKWRI